jgi:putative transcription factor
MLVCAKCQKLGKPYVDETPPRRPVTAAPPTGGPILKPTPRRRASELPRGMDELDLVEDYPGRVRGQRMKIGLSQEELARCVKEKLSVIQKIETGRMTPDMRLCRELEHELKVKLLVPRKEATVPETAAPAELTLGDIIRIKGKSKPNLKL